jgi:hypothetical protein
MGVFFVLLVAVVATAVTGFTAAFDRPQAQGRVVGTPAASAVTNLQSRSEVAPRPTRAPAPATTQTPLRMGNAVIWSVNQRIYYFCGWKKGSGQTKALIALTPDSAPLTVPATTIKRAG